MKMLRRAPRLQQTLQRSQALWPRLPHLARFPVQLSLRIKGAAGTSGQANGQGLQTYGTPAAGEARTGQAPDQPRRARWCALLLTLVYFVRGTFLPGILPLPAVGWIALSSLALLWAVGLGVAGGGRWRWPWVMVLVAFAASIFLAEEPISASLRWFGLALLILAVGPVILNPVAMEVRSAVWRFGTNGFLVLTGVFILWYLLRLPDFGVGFSSFMNQCMLLAPIVGMGIVIALAQAIHRRSWVWGLFAILGVIPLLASGSRVATLATIAGSCFLLIRRKPILGLGVLALCAYLICGFLSRGRNLESSSDSLTSAMAQKGDLNSRADLWESRLSDFESSPIFGIGIGMGSGASVGKDEMGAIRVEPGSSYLAVLAMTGGLGTAAFCSALVVLLFQFIDSPQKGGLDKDILSVVGIYLAVHGVAEGWILGFGSPLCFIFWLWLGKVGDSAWQRPRDQVQHRLRLDFIRHRPYRKAAMLSRCLGTLLSFE